MGAVTFSLDPRLIKVLKSKLKLNVFVETGTFKGETVESLKNIFERIYSIELSQEYYTQAQEKFKHFPHVTLLQGDSSTQLAAVIPQLNNEAAIFWLDAHWCVASNTAGELSQCPLLGELQSIGQLHADSVIIIDDARLFLSAPPAPHEITHWPSFNSIIKTLSSLSHSHHLIVVNDCIIYYPQKIENDLQLFAHQYGTDWLSALDKSRDYDKIFDQLALKDQEIKFLKQTCDEREAALMATNPAAQLAIHHNTQFNIIFDKLTQIEKHSSQTINHINYLKPYPESAELMLQTQDISLKQLQTEIEELKIALKKMETAQGSIKMTTEKITEVHREIMLTKESMSALDKQYLTLFQKQEKSLHLFRKFTIAGKIETLQKKIKKICRPKLGELYIYAPKKIAIPKRYKNASSLKKFPLISIVTPGFNHGGFIERTIQSVTQQGYPHLEYVVQDGGSTDGTLEILKKYDAAIKHWESAKDTGQSQAINLGFRHTSGEIMSYLNSDDLLLPGALHYVANYFAKNPDVDVIYSHRVLINVDDQEIGRWVLPPHDTNILSWADYVPQETLFWRRRIWDKIGGNIDEKFNFAMDWDLILRFRDSGAKFARVPRFLGAFRIHPHQKTAVNISRTGVEEMQRLRERCHGRAVSPQEIQENIRTYLKRHIMFHNLYRVGLLRY